MRASVALTGRSRLRPTGQLTSPVSLQFSYPSALYRDQLPSTRLASLAVRVNYVSHFLLTLHLLPLLQRGAERSGMVSRVVTVSSVFHRRGHTLWGEAMEFEPSRRTYPTSKLALACFAAELTRRYSQSHRIVGITVNPGAVNSDIWYDTLSLDARRSA